MRKKIEQIVEKISIIRESRKFDNMLLGTKECGEAIEEIKFGHQLLKEKKYNDLRIFYERKPYYFSAKDLSIIINEHPEAKESFIDMVKSNKRKFKRFFRNLNRILDDELSKMYSYNSEAHPSEKITFLRQFLTYSFVYQNGHITESAKELNNIRDICEHISLDLIQIFKDELLKSGSFENAGNNYLFKDRRKFIEAITSEEGQKNLLESASKSEKKCINRIIDYFENEKTVWQKVYGVSPKKKM